MVSETEKELNEMYRVNGYWPRGLLFDVQHSKRSLTNFKNYTVGASNCLDLGCSIKAPYKRFITLHGLDWYGADLMSPNEVSELNYRQVVDSHIPFEDNSFDIICVFNVVEHFTNIEKMFSEIHRCLKPNGILFGQSAFWEMEHSSFFHLTHRGLAAIVERHHMEMVHLEPTPISGVIQVAQRFFGGSGTILKGSLSLRVKSMIVCNLNWGPFIILCALEYVRKTLFRKWNSPLKDAASFWFTARKRIET